MWVSAFRRHLLTLGNNTTNRIESFNSQVKAELRKKKGIPPSLPETVAVLLSLVSKKDSVATYKNFRNSATVAANVVLPELDKAGQIYNDAGFKLLQQQLLKMRSKQFVVNAESSGSLTVEDVQSGKLYDLSPSPDGFLECTCTFSCAYPGLPCCHSIYSRKERGIDLFDAACVPDRWSRTVAVLGDHDAEDCAELEAPGIADVGTDESCCYSSEEEDAGILHLGYCFMF